MEGGGEEEEKEEEEEEEDGFICLKLLTSLLVSNYPVVSTVTPPRPHRYTASRILRCLLWGLGRLMQHFVC